jgi:hypothetical protein
MAGARLKDVQTREAKPFDKPFKLFDGGGMFLYITPGGGKALALAVSLPGKVPTNVPGTLPRSDLGKCSPQTSGRRRNPPQRVQPDGSP